MPEESFWRTWKPWVALAVAVGAAVWWYSERAPFAVLKDGAYSCRAVFVNEDGKYQALVDKSGARYPSITATVRNGKLASMSASKAVPADTLASLTMKKRGRSHFHVTDDYAAHSYNAVACDHAG